MYLDNQIQATIKELGLTPGEETELEVMNLFIDLSTEALRRIFWVFTTNLGIEDDYKPIINMKNESIGLHNKAIYYANLFKCLNFLRA